MSDQNPSRCKSQNHPPQEKHRFQLSTATSSNPTKKNVACSESNQPPRTIASFEFHDDYFPLVRKRHHHQRTPIDLDLDRGLSASISIDPPWLVSNRSAEAGEGGSGSARARRGLREYYDISGPIDSKGFGLASRILDPKSSFRESRGYDFFDDSGSSNNYNKHSGNINDHDDDDYVFVEAPFSTPPEVPIHTINPSPYKTPNILSSSTAPTNDTNRIPFDHLLGPPPSPPLLPSLSPSPSPSPLPKPKPRPRPISLGTSRGRNVKVGEVDMELEEEEEPWLRTCKTSGSGSARKWVVRKWV